MKVRLWIAALLLAGVATASVSEIPVLFNDNKVFKRMSSTAACTTNWIPCYNLPYMAFYCNAYVNTPTDSASFDIYFQVGIGNNKPIYGFLDTVKLACLGTNADSMRSAARCFGAEFYPPLATRVRFILQGLAGNSDSTYIDSSRLLGHTVNY